MNTLKNIQTQIKQNAKFTRFFKKADAQAEILFWKNRYNDLALKILCLEVEEPVETDVTTTDEDEIPTGYVRESELTKIQKQGNPYAVKPWRVARDSKIKEMLDAAVKSQIPFTRELFKGIAQRAGTTTPKVRQLANQYFPKNDNISTVVKDFFKI